jgi:hypothetical protein
MRWVAIRIGRILAWFITLADNDALAREDAELARRSKQ